jgi:tetratricopeptide (TPR) repeat protein
VILPLLSSVLLSLTISQGPAVIDSAAPDAGSLARAEALYDEAAYEESLSLLIAIETEDNAAEVEQYRALCLLALDRPADAERAVEQIVQRQPLFTMDAANVSPRLVVMFRDVRQRMLPTVAHNLYTRAKSNFDAGRYPMATAQLQEVVAAVRG